MKADLRILKNFITIATVGSFSKAAETLFIAQPALSLQIKNLEQEFGTALFNRHPRGVELTEAGELFFMHATDILRRYDLAYYEIRQAVSDPSGTVSIGLPQSIGQMIICPLIAHTLEQYPKIKLQFIEMGSAYVSEELLKGRIELGIMFGTDPDPRIKYSHLFNEGLALFTSPRQLSQYYAPYHLNQRPPTTIGLHHLTQFPMILPSASHSLRSRIDEYTSQENINLNIIAEVNTVPRLIDLACADLGSSILSFNSISQVNMPDNLVVIPITEPDMMRPIYACQLNITPLSLAATKIQDSLMNTIQELITAGQWSVNNIAEELLVP